MNKIYITLLLILATVLGSSAAYLFYRNNHLNSDTIIQKQESTIANVKDNSQSEILTHNFDMELNQCLEAATNTINMGDCYNKEMTKFNSLLEDVYTFIQTSNTKDFNKIIDQTKISFSKYREDLCNSDYELVKDGTIRGQVYGQCYIDITKIQIEKICGLGLAGQNCQNMI